jgi:hypothetical protein
MKRLLRDAYAGRSGRSRDCSPGSTTPRTSTATPSARSSWTAGRAAGSPWSGMPATHPGRRSAAAERRSPRRLPPGRRATRRCRRPRPRLRPLRERPRPARRAVPPGRPHHHEDPHPRHPPAGMAHHPSAAGAIDRAAESPLTASRPPAGGPRSSSSPPVLHACSPSRSRPASAITSSCRSSASTRSTPATTWASGARELVLAGGVPATVLRRRSSTNSPGRSWTGGGASPAPSPPC